TVTFATLASRTFGENPFALTATATSGLPITFTSDNESVAMIAGSTVTIVGAGVANITASQPGNSQYLPAQSVTRPLLVNKAPQTIAFAPLPERRVGEFPFQLVATASSGLPVQYACAEINVIELNQEVVVIVGAGTANITASQPGNSNYLPAQSVTQTLTVRPLMVTQEEANAVLAQHWVASPPNATNFAIAAQPNYTFVITNADSATVTFKVQFSADLDNPNWQDVGLRFVAPNSGYYRMVPQ
ncbi:MAG TPA: hypothetical protein PK640_12810, partial [Verrucomicrobiota bacterium]|nr:hypothetical protein [Verrucomicrobiota bacterium]